MPYCEINDRNADLQNFVTLVLSDNSLGFKEISGYLNEGGTIIGETDVISRIFNIKTRNGFVKYFIPGKNQSLCTLPCDIYKRCSVPAAADMFPDQLNINTWMNYDSGKGRMIILPSGITSLMNDGRIKRKNFYSPYSRKEMNERVSAVSKGSIYHLMQAALEDLFHFRNLPFVSLWPFPEGRQNIFLFRIDTDFAGLEDLSNLYSVCSENNIRAAWFVETGSAGADIDFFGKFENQETGLHCHRHKVFGTYKSNYENISEGLNTLKKIDVYPDGFAAPYGEWNTSLGKVLGDLNFTYSSEFGFAYDALPFHPFINGSFSKTLQIPIHPVSTGRLHWGGHSEENMINYFDYIIGCKLALCEPLIFYAHPGEKRFHIFDRLFKKINQLGIYNYSFIEYARWWRGREKVNFSASYDEGRLKIDPLKENSSVRIKIVYPDKKIYLSGLYGDADLNKKKIEIPEQVPFSPENYYHLRETTSRMIWHDILHKYRKLRQ